MHVLFRILAILIDPAGEWERIEGEIDDPVSLMIRYVAPLAAVPPIFDFLGTCIVGVIGPGGATIRAPLLDGILGALFGYLESFVLVLLLALITNLVAPLFGSRRTFVNAFKLVIYSFTPVWLSGIFLILPGLRFLVLTGFYGAFIVVVGLPHLLKPAKENTSGFAALIVVFACLLTFFAAAAQSALFGRIGL